MATSQNGWTANDRSLVSRRQVPGTDVWLTVRNGIPGDLLLWIAQQVDQRVESIDNGRAAVDDWGYAERPIRGGWELSNHASGTAIDLNAPRHPLGATNTFQPWQVDEIHKIGREASGVVRWGGDYVGRKDQMHWELVGNAAAVTTAWHRIQQRQIKQKRGVIHVCDKVMPARFAYKYGKNDRGETVIVKSDSTAIIKFGGEWTSGGWLGLGNGTITVHTHWTIEETAKVKELLVLPEIAYQDDLGDVQWVRQKVQTLAHWKEFFWLHLSGGQFGGSLGFVDNGFDFSTFPSTVEANLIYGIG